MQKFEKRKTAPKSGNKWYTGVAGGGVSNCITDIRHPRWKNATVDNCAGGGHGRYFEAQAVDGVLFGAKSKEEIRKIFATRKKGESPVEMWAAYKADPKWKYYCKSTPKQGAICFYKRVKGNGYAGHMNNIEAVNDNGRCDILNNNYETAPRYSYKTNIKPSELYGGYFVVLGYLWPIADFEGTKYTTTDALNVRKTPGGELLGTFRAGTVVTVAGDHKDHQGVPWKYVKGKTRDGRTVTGYVSIKYLK